MDKRLWLWVVSGSWVSELLYGSETPEIVGPLVTRIDKETDVVDSIVSR